MIFLYNIFLYMAGIIFLPFLSIVLLFNKKWRVDLKERFAIIKKETKEKAVNKKFIWFHAASVGEVQAIAPAIRELKKLVSDKEIIITTTSLNGKNRAKKELGDIIFDAMLLPLDFNFIIKKFLNNFNIEALIIMETEIWPNLIYYADKRKIPLILINGRISDKSFKYYYFLRFLIAKLLNKISVLIVQSEKMKIRFKKLGMDEKKIMVILNIKYSFELKIDEKIKNLDKKDKLFIIAGSIREKEEDFILDVFNKIKNENIVFFIAPRHLDRVDFIVNLIEKYKFNFQKFSLISNYSEMIKYNLILVDTIGDLIKLYSIGDIAIVGGGFQKFGGHNPLEPAYFSLPVIAGNFMYNFEDTIDKMVKEGGAFKVNNKQELYEKLNYLIANENQRKMAGQKNKEIIEKMQGTAETTAFIINEILLEKKMEKKND